MPIKKKPGKRSSTFFYTLVGLFALSSIVFFWLQHNETTQEVAGISSTSGEMNLKQLAPCVTGTTASEPCKQVTKPAVYVSSETLTRGNCFPGFQSISFTCTDGYTGSIIQDTCANPQMLVQTAEMTCVKRGITPMPTRVLPSGVKNKTNDFPMKLRPSQSIQQ